MLLDDYPDGRNVCDHLKLTLCGNDEEKGGIEDVFSTLDFKNFILHKRIGITESNTEYIRDNNLSREILASEFTNHLQEHKTSLQDFDEETRANINELVSGIDALLSR